VIAPPSNSASGGGGYDQAAPASGGGTATSSTGGGRNSSAGGAGQAQPASTAPNAGSGGDTPQQGSPRPQITGNTQGVIGIDNLKLEAAPYATQGSVLSSEKNNVKVESGTMLLLKVTQ